MQLICSVVLVISNFSLLVYSHDYFLERYSHALYKMTMGLWLFTIAVQCRGIHTSACRLYQIEHREYIDLLDYLQLLSTE